MCVCVCVCVCVNSVTAWPRSTTIHCPHPNCLHLGICKDVAPNSHSRIYEIPFQVRMTTYGDSLKNSYSSHLFLVLGISFFLLLRSNKMQQHAGIYLLQNHSTCFGCPSHPSSGVHKTVTAASGAGHSIWATTFLQRGQGLLTACEQEHLLLLTSCRGCSYSFMYSWWWVRGTPEACRVILL